jgi:hypothetical protein
MGAGLCKDGLIQRILDFTPEAGLPQPRKIRDLNSSLFQPNQ